LLHNLAAVRLVRYQFASKLAPTIIAVNGGELNPKGINPVVNRIMERSKQLC
jgi:hypothetical protein